MSLHSLVKPNPAIERGDGLDHGVDASMPASRALTMEETNLSMLSSSLSSVTSYSRGRRSLTICRSIVRFVWAHKRFLVGVAGCQLQSMARQSGDDQSHSLGSCQSCSGLCGMPGLQKAKVRSIVDSPSFHRWVGVPGTVRSCNWKSSMIVRRC